MALQFQFDVVQAGAISLDVISHLLKVCAEEDIQPLVFQSLESFGQWLMVDHERLAQGEEALQDSESKRVRFQNLIFGYSDSELVKIVRNSLHLTAAFVFIAGCSVLNSQSTGKLIHELLKLRGGLQIGSHQLCQFVERIRGYRKYLSGATPFGIYDTLASDFWIQASNQQLRIDDVYNDTHIQRLAELIYEIHDALQDKSNEFLVLRGSRTGMWLATLLIWLHPRETGIWVGEAQVHPPPSPGDASTNSDIRLFIIFVEKGPPADRTWHLEKWKLVQGLLDEAVINLDMDDRLDIPLLIPSPLHVAKYRIATNVFSELDLDTIGHLAGALVIFAVDTGLLWWGERHLERLKLLCSEYFLDNYSNALAWFGWESLDKGRVDQVVICLRLSERVNDARYVTAEGQYLTSMKRIILAATIDLKPKLFNNDDTHNTLIELAVHLATEALFFSLCDDRPPDAVYRPIEPKLLQENARVLWSLLGDTRIKQIGHPYLAFADFRNLAIEVMIPIAGTVVSSVLAVSADGYIAYDTSIQNLRINSTNKRIAAGFHVCPGTLKLNGVQGRFQRLVERVDALEALTTRIKNDRNRRSYPIDIFAPDGSFQGIDDRGSMNPVDISVAHVIQTSYEAVGILFIITYLQ